MQKYSKNKVFLVLKNFEKNSYHILGLDSMTLQILSYLLISVALLWLLQVDCNFLNKTQYSGPWLNVFKLGNTDVVTAILFVWKIQKNYN